MNEPPPASAFCAPANTEATSNPANASMSVMVPSCQTEGRLHIRENTVTHPQPLPGRYSAHSGAVVIGLRILLVEDEPLVREIMAETLAVAGFDVTATCTGDEAAILLADQDRFDLLLTDINMPGSIDGIGLAEHARQVHPGLPLLFVSGRPDHERRACMLPQPMEFMPKPYDPEALLVTIGTLMAAG